jgi:hypothetical protein
MRRAERAETCGVKWESGRAGLRGAGFRHESVAT